MCFSHVSEILLPVSLEVIDKVSHQALAERRSFARGCSDSNELSIFIPLVHELQDLDCN